MSAKGYRKPRICRVCGEQDPTKFVPELASLCHTCMYDHRKEAQRVASAEWRERNPEKVETIRKEWAEYMRQYGIDLRTRNKIAVLSHYGPNRVLQCSWDGCEISDIDMLVLDHIDDNGAEEKRKLGGSSGRGHIFYAYLKKKKFPEGYQTLCCNHNHKKELLRNRAQGLNFGIIARPVLKRYIKKTD